MFDLSANWERLDAASYRVSVIRSVRRSGWVSAVVGVLCAALGFVPPGSPVLVALGAMLGLTGAWNVRRPSPAGLIVDGASIIALGIFNCSSLLWAEGADASSAGRWIVAGVVQIVWGVRRLAGFRAARAALSDPEAMRQLETLVRDLAKRKPKSDPGVIEFVTGRVRSRRNRSGLYPEGAVALLDNREVIRMARRDEITIEKSGKAWIGRSIVVRVRMGDLEMKGEMSAEHYERFENWKLGVSRPQAFAA